MIGHERQSSHAGTTDMEVGSDRRRTPSQACVRTRPGHPYPLGVLGTFDERQGRVFDGGAANPLSEHSLAVFLLSNDGRDRS